MQHLRYRSRLQAHALALVNSVSEPDFELVPPGHDRCARGRARRAGMEVRKTHALIVQAVEVRRLDQRITVARDVAIALIVGEDEDQVGAPRMGSRSKQRRSKGG